MLGHLGDSTLVYCAVWTLSSELMFGPGSASPTIYRWDTFTLLRSPGGWESRSCHDSSRSCD
ncbi:hypothetical protein TcasGA2_TC032712 [Tribolium castaneum]|uniref:Uncharacterized protein n=1 Tax=Tribolium castaneum TaxID=7070 RepID=A0A139W9H0_TRICA|nr:hypothetical protein TcasGA2_TC032712 [Tribolium castaneum]